MGTCYSVQGKGEMRPYITVKPLSRESPILQGDADSPVKGAGGDLELPTKSVLKNSSNWSQSSSPLFEKKVHRQVSFDLMSELVLPSSSSSESSPLKPAPLILHRGEGSTAGNAVVSEQSKANNDHHSLLPVCCASLIARA